MKNISTAIAIGTSAGGINALLDLLPLVPDKANITIFVVQHISPESDSFYIKLIKSKCKIKVKEACHTEEIKTGIIYFAPPDYHLLIEKNYTLTLTSDEKVNFSRPSIDVLFETAAETYKNRLTGILLTGANNDGSRGLKRIQELGGKTIIQSPVDAAFSEMPASALKLIKPDMVFTLDQLAEFMSRLT